MQEKILRETWAEMFVLTAAQNRMTFNLESIMATNGLKFGEGLFQAAEELRIMQDVIKRYRELSIDASEYMYLQAIILFRNG